jgi:NAD(P)-dependent dehydrogenase (short-subunit alcohol dehydrogenase family)
VAIEIALACGAQSRAEQSNLLLGQSFEQLLLSREPLEVLAAELARQRIEVLVVPADLRNRAELERVLAAARTRFGSIDVLVNNAGLAGVSGTNAMFRSVADGRRALRAAHAPDQPGETRVGD